jgi:hypothetical protein
MTMKSTDETPHYQRPKPCCQSQMSHSTVSCIGKNSAVQYSRLMKECKSIRAMISKRVTLPVSKSGSRSRTSRSKRPDTDRSNLAQIARCHLKWQCHMSAQNIGSENDSQYYTGNHHQSARQANQILKSRCKANRFQ